MLRRFVPVPLFVLQRRRLHRTKDRRVPLCSFLGRRCSHIAIPSARSLACEITRPHMRNCGTGGGRGLPENTGRTRVGQLRSCQIHGSRPLTTRYPHALRGRAASNRPGQRFDTSAQCDQHASCSRRSGQRARTRRRASASLPGAERRQTEPVAFFGPVRRQHGHEGNKRKDSASSLPRVDGDLPLLHDWAAGAVSAWRARACVDMWEAAGGAKNNGRRTASSEAERITDSTNNSRTPISRAV